MKIIVDHVVGSRRGQRQEFDLVNRVRIGRHPDNDISFDAHRDLDASARHAELQRKGDGFVLRDMGSSNGTFVDGEKVTEYPIAIGQQSEVEFGEGGPRLRIFIGDPEAMPVPPTLPAQLPGTIGATGHALDGGGDVGPRTMAMMVRAARAQAGDRKGVGRTGVFVRSMVDQALHRSSRKFKIAMFSVVGVLVAVVVALVLWQASERDRMDAERRANDERLAQIERDNLIRQDMMKQMQFEGPGPLIASQYGPAVYLLVVKKPENDGPQGFCTGFAVNAHYLGTNAHCVVEVRKFLAGKLEVYALRNGGGVEPLSLKKSIKHTKYRGGLSEDVGLIEVDGAMEVTVQLAGEDDLRKLKSGANVFTLGFPGRLVKRVTTEAVEATIVNGIIGRMTNFQGQRADFEARMLVQHNLLTSPGTSGSPVFDGFGRVVAINAGSYTETRTDVLVDPETGEQLTIARAALTPGANYAIRVDALHQVMSENGVQPSAGSGGLGGGQD